MRIRQPRATAVRTALRLVGLIVVLAGLFGMHGLANHGVDGSENMPHTLIPEASTSPVEPSLELMSAGMSDQTGPVLEPALGSAGLVSGLDHEDGMNMNMNMAGLCVAILLVGVGAMRKLLCGRRLAPVLWPMPRAAGSIAQPGRDPDPPSLTVLSIQRC